MIELLTSAEAWAALLTLTVLEIVLGIDNFIFISVIVSRIPEPQAADRWPDDRLVLLGQMIGDGSYLTHAPMRYTTASEENSEAVRGAAEPNRRVRRSGLRCRMR